MGNSIYKPVSLEVGNILKGVQTGKIGLPDLQHPFVWKNDKVRQLLDSMLRGYPIGYIMLWESPADYSEKKAVPINQLRNLQFDCPPKEERLENVRK